MRTLLLCCLTACATPAGDAEDDTVDTGSVPTIRAVTFNTGTSIGLGHDDPPGDGYTAEMAAVTDDLYGNAMSWPTAEDAATAWLSTVAPDVVAFQEILHDPLCEEIDVDPDLDLACRGYDADAPTQPERVLGEGFQVACHPGKPDKCLGVRRAFGTIRGCDARFCLEGLEGLPRIDDCGSPSRVGKAVIDLAAGGTLTVVSVHGNSGISAGDQRCRTALYRAVFDELADGDRNLVLGDFNTDPVALAGIDPSADVLAARIAGAWTLHTPAGDDAPKAYGGIADIDHVLSDAFDGDCWHAGLDGRPPVLEAEFFDHRPAVCDLR